MGGAAEQRHGAGRMRATSIVLGGLDLRLQIGDRLLLSSDCIGASSEAAGRLSLARNRDARARELGRIR